MSLYRAARTKAKSNVHVFFSLCVLFPLFFLLFELAAVDRYLLRPSSPKRLRFTRATMATSAASPEHLALDPYPASTSAAAHPLNPRPSDAASHTAALLAPQPFPTAFPPQPPPYSKPWHATCLALHGLSALWSISILSLTVAIAAGHQNDGFALWLLPLSCFTLAWDIATLLV